MSEPLKSAEAIKEMGKAVLCLHLELVGSIADDVQKRWDELVLSLAEREEEIREEYDSALREKMIQQLWFKTKGLSKKNPKIELSIVEKIINEAKVEEKEDE